MFKCMLNGFGPGCEDTKLYGSNVQSQGGAGNEKWGMAIGCWGGGEWTNRYGMYCMYVQVTMYIS